MEFYFSYAIVRKICVWMWKYLSLWKSNVRIFNILSVYLLTFLVLLASNSCGSEESNTAPVVKSIATAPVKYEKPCEGMDCEVAYSSAIGFPHSRSYNDEKWDSLPDFEYLKKLYHENGKVHYSTVNRIVTGEIEKDEAVSSSFGRLGINYSIALKLNDAMKEVFDFRWCRVGNSWALAFDKKNQIKWFALYYNRLETYYVRNEDGILKAYKLIGQTESYLIPIAGVIKSSLSVALWKLGETDALTMKISDVFAWDIDFYSDLQKGDVFRVLVEKRYYQGEFLGYGRVHAASFHGDTLGDMYAVHYETPDKKRAEYFDEKDNALQKSFLRAPINTVRVTSKYGFRMHPTLHKYKKHNGVDFGAPRGTPVWAIASGRVLKAQWMGACGKGVKIRHANRYESLYCHLSVISVKAGMHVRQKDMVGRVGNTGRSTGPHLHFGLKKNGQWMNPRDVKYEPGKPVDEKYMEDWLNVKKDMIAKLNAIDPPVFYGPVLPPNMSSKELEEIAKKEEVPFDDGELIIDN